MSKMTEQSCTVRYFTTPERHRADRPQLALISLRHSPSQQYVRATLVNFSDLAAVEQHHQAHTIKPPIGRGGINSEQVEIRPSALDGGSGPAI